MPRRPPKTDPELQAHKEWLGYLQPRGLVVAPAAMWEAGWVLEESGKELLERQEQFREALHPLGHEEDDEDDQPRGFRQLEALLVEQLSWDANDLQRDEPTLQTWTRDLPELGETLQPTAVVRGFGSDDKPQLLIQELPELEEGQLPPGEPVDFDRRQASGDQGWRGLPPGALRAAAARNRGAAGAAVQRIAAAAGGGAQGRELGPSHLHAGRAGLGERAGDVCGAAAAARARGGA
jgi:hypothetical protein